MRQTTLTKYGAPGRVIGLTNFRTGIQCMDFVEIFNVSLDLSTICFANFGG